MKVETVVPASTAADPAHPDHDRWVKDRTLQMEAEHAQRVGIPYAHAEAENQRLLVRMDWLAQREALTPQPSPVERISREERIEQRGVDVAPTKVRKPRRQCQCSMCLSCRRRMRLALILIKAREGDKELLTMAARLFGMSMDAGNRVGKFANLAKRDAERALSAKVDAVFDNSVRLLGPWR